MSAANWKVHFSQPISGYDPVEAQGLSELGYALLHHQIPEVEYLKWARENFELASLDMKFFQTVTPPRKLFEKWKDTYSWGPECLPIGEWDDHLLIAGLIKPEDMPLELKPIFLLAPIKGLLEYWTQFQEEQTVDDVFSEEESSESTGMPDGFDLKVAENLISETPAMSLSFSGVSLAHPETTTPAPAAVKIQINTNHEIKPLGNINGINSKPISDAKTSIPLEAKPSIPKVNPGLLVQPTKTELIAVTTPAAGPNSSYTMPPLKPKVPPPQTAKTASPAADADTAIVQPATKIPESTITEIKAEPTVVPNPSVAAESEINIGEDFIKECFSQYRKHYEKQLYIQYNDAGKYAIAKFWPSDFVATETPTKHALIDDSFLAIVSKTQKSYHGYVVKNTITDNFFTEVNSGHTPENITLVPIIKNDVVVGALMGWGPKTTYNMNVLKTLEKTVADLTLKLGWSIPEAA